MQLDPHSAIINSDIAPIHLCARKYDDAVATCRKFISENPRFARPHDMLAEAYRLKGMHPEMLSEYKTYGELSGDPLEKAVSFAMDEAFRSGGLEVRFKKRNRDARGWSQKGLFFAILHRFSLRRPVR